MSTSTQPIKYLHADVLTDKDLRTIKRLCRGPHGVVELRASLVFSLLTRLKKAETELQAAGSVCEAALRILGVEECRRRELDNALDEWQAVRGYR